ncbi:MAG: site-specific integrase [Coriobacteriales bacterium]|jgi:integrase|nr:site-specific integrase [Coriobacteriales bacterium]
MEEYRNELERGIDVSADSVTFSAWANTYCSGREIKSAASPATLRHDRDQVRILNQYLDNVKVKDITSAAVGQVMVAMGEDGRSPGAIKRALMMLKRLLREACSHNIILRNPAENIRAPKVVKPEVKALSEDRAALLIKALKECPAYLQFATEQNQLSYLSSAVATRMLLATGARRGEGLGLTWGHINFEDSSIRIEQQLTTDGIRQPKTKAGRRRVTIDADTLKLLRAWKIQQAKWLLKNGIAQSETTPVISTTGHFYHVDDYSHWWRKFRKEYGFDDVTIHMLRHTHATLLIGAGVDIKTVQHRLGHESASITMNLYAHFIKSKDAECVLVMDALIAKQVPEMGKVVNL